MTTLEKIRAEIAKIRDSWEKDCYHDEADALALALQIIDKYAEQEPCRVKNELKVELNELEPCDGVVSIQDVLKTMCEFCPVYNCTSKCSSYKHIKDLPSVIPQEPKWIPVSERLPNHDEYIKNNGLFNVSDGNRSYSEWFDAYKQRFGEPTMSGFRVDYAVIAWVPLPESYKIESGGAKMVEPTCDTCEYNTAAFMPCNACEDKSEYKPRKSEDKE